MFTDDKGKEWPLSTSGKVADTLAKSGILIYRWLTGPLDKLQLLVEDVPLLLHIGLIMATDKDGNEPTVSDAGESRMMAAVLEALPEFFSDHAGVELCRGVLATAQRINKRAAEVAAILAQEKQNAEVQGLQESRVGD